jgi:hypothetical protein
MAADNIFGGVRVQLPVTVAASAARTAAFQSADIDARGFKGIVVYFNVSVASGTGGLTLRLEGKDPVSGNYFLLGYMSAAVTSAAARCLMFGPGVTGQENTFAGYGGKSCLIPDTVRVSVGVGDASSYTYSIGASLTP